MQLSWSRSTRIKTLLVIDVLFFIAEITVGYVVGSLALVADSFHMLNDVLSLVVALYAIKLSNNPKTLKFTYGWNRAEIVAALMNGVFLLALCFSIFLEAIQRFFNIQEVSNPMLVVIVGCLGLASNILGLFLFHEHDHSHGDSEGNKSHSPQNAELDLEAQRTAHPNSSSSSLEGHPAQTRASLVQAAHEMQNLSSRATTTLPDEDLVLKERVPSGSGTNPSPPRTPSRAPSINHSGSSQGHEPTPRQSTDAPSVSRPSKESHSHNGSMNMRALVLHVTGDALGNIGVILSGLVIWLAHTKGRFYFDPAVSLLITCIIFSSALPLVRSAAFILLQGTPSSISVEDIRTAILRLPGVQSVHELHVWQLSETKIVASLHVWVSSGVDYMDLAMQMRKVLHDHGVHSATIQPEFSSDTVTSENLEYSTSVDTQCLISCPPGQDCNITNACCPPGEIPTDIPVTSTGNSPDTRP
ncbi:cation efflux protein [Sistotremastrum niveocremeum HHB9708]|uniref:Cation efflux protein n=1 Tax=Sistotremastrum niveocremeum HHB9708 TaxID=1314777 RepID=A0A164UBS0_9AGAM|nr:cation efflux protein [Sistotremastrum niveocremeum HHB9708]